MNRATAAGALESAKSRSGLTPRELMAAWGRVLHGTAPMLSIEITRECPLSCPGFRAPQLPHMSRKANFR